MNLARVASNNPRLIRYAVNANILVDIAVAAWLIGMFVWLLFNSSGPDGGFAIIFGFVYLGLAVIPLADSRILFQSSRQAIRRRLWSYFSVTRMLVLIGMTRSFYGYAQYGSTLQNDSTVRYTAIIIGFALIFSGAGIVFYRAVKGKWQLILLLAAALFSLLAIGYINIAIGHSEKPSANGGLAGTRRDNQTARDFQLLSQDIDNYMLNAANYAFPTDLRQAITAPNSYGSEENVADRVDRYTYTYDNLAGTFKLCAVFTTDTTGSEPETTGVTKAYRHMKGYQCFSFETTHRPDAQIQAPSQDQGVQIYNY
jgi:hypothetical protein